MYKIGEPCSHPGCLSHRSHPCEGCGRVAGVPVPKELTDRLETLQTAIDNYCTARMAHLEEYHSQDVIAEILMCEPTLMKLFDLRSK